MTGVSTVGEPPAPSESRLRPPAHDTLAWVTKRNSLGVGLKVSEYE